jgi:hypothetical protein
MSGTDSDTPQADGPSGDEVAELRRELAELRKRVSELESRLAHSSSTLPPAASDYGDARVLDVLESGQTVHLRDLRRLYFEHTDIRDGDTVRDRIQDLVESSAFEPAAKHQRWTYLGSVMG